MTTAATLGSLALATVLAIAGTAKLLDRQGSRRAARSFGVPRRLTGVVGIGLPFIELAIAGLLLAATTRWWGAVAALGLLLVFCAAICVALLRGMSPDCHCFGQLHSAPAGWTTLARNGLLVLLAALVLVTGSRDTGPSTLGWTSRLDGSQWLVLVLGVALLGVVAIGGYAVIHVMRSYGRVLVRLETIEAGLRAFGIQLDDPDDVPGHGLEPGTPAPAFELASVDGERVSFDDLRAPGNPVLLLFTSPTCGPCSALMPAIAGWQRDHRDELTVALVSHGDPEAIRAEASKYQLVNVLVDETQATSEAYQANGTPSAVLVGDDGTVATWLAAGAEWIESVVEQALAGAGRRPGLPVGAELPALKAQTLDGDEIPLTDAVERETVLVFWNPDCGYCRSLRDDLRVFEAAAPGDAPALVVVSGGEPADVQDEGFTSTVLLDSDWSVSSALGATGTPSAVLVSAEKRIASGIASGGDRVLELLGAGKLAVAGEPAQESHR